MIGRKPIGIPLKLTLSEKNLKKELVEIKKRRTGEIFLVKREEVISKIQEMITEEMTADSPKDCVSKETMKGFMEQISSPV
jgi:prolyl-tRNA synthetase